MKSDDFEGIIGQFGVSGWPWQAQVGVLAVIIILVAIYFLRKPPTKKDASASSGENHAINALAKSIQRAGEEVAGAHSRADRAEKMLRGICEVILDHPPPEISHLQDVARETLKGLKSAR